MLEGKLGVTNIGSLYNWMLKLHRLDAIIWGKLNLTFIFWSNHFVPKVLIANEAGESTISNETHLTDVKMNKIEYIFPHQRKSIVWKTIERTENSTRYFLDEKTFERAAIRLVLSPLS